MSRRLKDCQDFLKALLKGSRVQGEAILITASEKQVNCLGEVASSVVAEISNTHVTSVKETMQCQNAKRKRTNQRKGPPPVRVKNTPVKAEV